MDMALSITRTMIINDVHIPYHNSKLIDVDATGLIPEIIDDLKLDRLIINGDLLDMYSVNMHGPKHPDVKETLEEELIAGRNFFESMRKRFPKLEIVYLMGNHENRLDRFILKNSKVFWNLLTVENYLELDNLNVEWFPYNHKYRLEKTNCFIQHSPPSYGVNGARTSLLKKLDQCHIYGCTHREQKACVTAASGKTYSVYFNGWLGSTNQTKGHTEVFSYAKGHEDWQNCFTIVNVINEKEHHVNQYSIRNNKVCIDGYIYEA